MRQKVSPSSNVKICSECYTKQNVSTSFIQYNGSDNSGMRGLEKELIFTQSITK